MAFKKLTDEEKAARVAAKAAKSAEPKVAKVRKVCEPGPKAPKRADAPALWAAYEVNRALKVVTKIDNATSGWTDATKQHFTDALASLGDVVAAFATLPAAFKAPRKGKGGRGPTFVAGQRVELSSDAMARVQQLFPDVKGDCVFQVGNVQMGQKMFPIVCLGVDGNLAPFFVDRAPRKDLTPFSVPATV